MGLFDKWRKRGATPSDDIDQAAFAELFVARVRASGFTGELEYEPDSFALRGANGARTFLHNAFRAYSQAPPEGRDDCIAVYTAQVGAPDQVPDDFAAAAPLLTLSLRHRFMFWMVDYELRRQKPDAAPFQMVPVAKHLAAAVAYDTPRTVAQVGGTQFDTWGVSFEHAAERALRNLRARSAHAWKKLAPGLWQSPWSDYYDPSRLCLPELIRALPVRGQHVALAPSRMVLLVTGSEDVEGLATMLEVGKEAEAADRPLSLVPVILADDGLVPYAPERSHPKLGAYREARVLEEASLYADQKKTLERILEGEDLFVASCQAVKKKTGEVIHYATWTETVATLLPETDEVALVRLDGGTEPSTVLVSWQELKKGAADLLALEPGVYPPRYRTKGFPHALHATLAR